MRFYILPTEEGTTTAVNFDHVAYISVKGPSIEIYFAGVEAPMVVKKTPTTLSFIGKGMDVSDSSKEQLSNL